MKGCLLAIVGGVIVGAAFLVLQTWLTTPPGPASIPPDQMTLQQKMDWLKHIQQTAPDQVEQVKQQLGILRDFMLQAKDAFGASIEQFDGQSQTVQQEFEAGAQTLLTFKEAVKTAADKYPEFQKVYTQWNKIDVEIGALDGKLSSLDQMSVTFYQAAKEYAATINDPKLQTNALKELEESESKYRARLEKARLSVARLKEAKTNVDDAMKALEIHFSLEVAEDTLNEVFTEIDATVTEVMGELELLSQQSRELLNSL